MLDARMHATGTKATGLVPMTKPELHYDVVVIGAGPAGLAAAVGAREAGAERVLVLDRKEYTGGMLPQCIHDGFGYHLFGQRLTGPEYARHWESRAREAGARISLGTMVLNVQPTTVAGVNFFIIEVMGSSLGGHSIILARSVIAATGCRERTAEDLGIQKRPSGVMTAGTAQYMANVLNEMPGDEVVILGSDNIGLIMARRLSLLGANVRMVLGEESKGLLRNHVRCILDFGIPFRENWGITSIQGARHLKGVKIAPRRADGSYDLSREEHIGCNLLLLACGLEPDRDVFGNVIGCEGLYLCGDANYSHDLVDQITQEGLQSGIQAAIHSGVPATDVLRRIKGLGMDRMLLRKIVAPKGMVLDPIGTSLDAKRIPCTVCPARCIMSVGNDGKVVGHACERGKAYAMAESISPMRTFTGTVKLVNAAKTPLLPVRTSCEVPREALHTIANVCRALKAQAPIKTGQVICANIAGTAADLVATSSISHACA